MRPGGDDQGGEGAHDCTNADICDAVAVIAESGCGANTRYKDRQKCPQESPTVHVLACCEKRPDVDRVEEESKGDTGVEEVGAMGRRETSPAFKDDAASPVQSAMVYVDARPVPSTGVAVLDNWHLSKKSGRKLSAKFLPSWTQAIRNTKPCRYV
eukprot:CAMPEP_0196667210 /NCGR_PEP_ID=MMETSP1086-20130531/64957_1 /TAXON_ID=77921 /ORGANISM="Cyanoptyche  gloeocystis , Strain SAG4.97" /LENGTH=154 /DNA_ID=CAMNT_0042004515 /DNA_START=1182 /DNA_END=1647 /DNA_ORIENTATION=-